MFTTLVFPADRLTMSSRRRGEDMSLYDFAKKYRENQSSSELVKKQNATEDKVLSARLEYLNNQKVLTMKTLEKEIDLIKRRKKYGWDSPRTVSSHHFDRASLPNTPRRWTKDNFSPAKFVKRKSQQQLVTKNKQDRAANFMNTTDANKACETHIPSPKRNENDETLVQNRDLHVVNVTPTVNINSSMETLATENNIPEIPVNSDTMEKTDQHKSNPILISKSIFPSTAGRDHIPEKTNNQVFPSWSRYSTHQRQNLSKPQDSKRTPTPRLEENNDHCINGFSVNLNLRQARSHHADNIKLDNTKYNRSLDLERGLTDLRFKNLESVLIPH